MKVKKCKNPVYMADAEALHVMAVELVAPLHVEMISDEVQFLRGKQMVGMLASQRRLGVRTRVLGRANRLTQGVMLVLVEGCPFTVMLGTLGAELLEFGGRDGDLESLDHGCCLGCG